MVAAEFTPEPDLILHDGALGHQRSSMRPSSARYSIGRSPIACQVEEKETPGPLSYSKAPHLCTGVPAAIFGDAQRDDGIARPYPYPDVDDLGIIDVSKVRPRPARAVIGQEERGGRIIDPELLRTCPEARYGHDGPGPKYEPNYRSASCGANSITGRRQRPSSAPIFTRSGRRAPKQDVHPDVGPDSYKTDESGFGQQRDSRRRTSRSSSFSRSDRFAPPRRAQGDLAAECALAASTVGRDEAGRASMRRPASATFGSSTRESSGRTMLCTTAGDRPRSAAFNHPPRLPHPTVAPQRDVVRWGCAR